MTARFRPGPALLAGALLLTACGADPDIEDPGSPSPSASSSSPSGTASGDDGLTDPGTELGVGEAATFSWQPTQKLMGTLEVTVDRIDQTTMKAFTGFKMNRDLRRSTPYYVSVTVRNMGETDLGGHDLPLFLDNGSDVLQPSAQVTSSFPPCPSRPLPAKFQPGQQTELCLVFLAPDRTELSSIVLRPNEEFVPITWTGEVTRPDRGEKKRKGKKRG